MRVNYIGVDGGGTHSTAVLLSEDGSILKVAKGGGLNYHAIGMESARQNLKAMVLALSEGLSASSLQIGVGMSALDSRATDEQLHAFAGKDFDPQRLFLHSDAYAALMAATLGQSGAMVICGTGSMIVYADETLRQIPAGGWGYLLGDSGSSYTLAIEGMRACIRAFEGTGEATALQNALLERFSLASPRSLIDFVYSEHTKPSDIAQFAIDVLQHAQSGDSIAKSILENNLRALAHTLYCLTEEKLPVPVWLYGGVFEHNPWVIELFKRELDRFKKDADCALSPYSPAVGAAIYAMIERRTFDAKTIQNIKNTYRESDFS